MTPRTPGSRIPNPESRIPRLIAIVDADAAAGAGWTMEALADQFLVGGARLLQLRAKHMPSGAFLEAASGVVRRAHDAHALVVVNDRADVARLSGADGVHVGQDDLSVFDARSAAGRAMIVGLSTHTPDQLADALGRHDADRPDYVAIGPVFDTLTKATGYDARGLERVREASRITSRVDVPLVAIGGITLETAPLVVEAGASSVAVISDLVGRGDPAARVRAYLERLTV